MNKYGNKLKKVTLFNKYNFYRMVSVLTIFLQNI